MTTKTKVLMARSAIMTDLLPIFLVVFFVFFPQLACAHNHYSSQGSYYDGYKQMMQLVNQARAAKSIPPMCISPKLMESAKRHCEYQASIGQMTHAGPQSLFDRFTNVGFDAQAVAENVAWTSSFSVDRVMNLWLNSPGHYANIVGNYTHFGSFAIQAMDGKIYWTQHFARPWSNVVEQCEGQPQPQPSQSTTIVKPTLSTQPPTVVTTTRSSVSGTLTTPTRTSPTIRTTLITTVLTIVYTVKKK